MKKELTKAEKDILRNREVRENRLKLQGVRGCVPERISFQDALLRENERVIALDSVRPGRTTGGIDTLWRVRGKGSHWEKFAYQLIQYERGLGVGTWTRLGPYIESEDAKNPYTLPTALVMSMELNRGKLDLIPNSWANFGFDEEEVIDLIKATEEEGERGIDDDLLR